MDTLNRVIEMKKRGMSNTEISRQLQNEGINPKEINDSFNQAQVKNAVSESYENETNQMQPSMMSDQNNPQINSQGNFPGNSPMQNPAQKQPVTHEMQESQMPPMQAPQPPAQQQMQQNPEIYPPQQYSEYGNQNDYYYPETPQAYQSDYYMPSGGTDTDTIAEIAEQVVSEKFSEFHKKTGDLVTFKNSIQDKVADIDSRLKRIEESIDKLQSAIIGKVGEFGENTAMIHKDLDNLHNTMSKMMNPLIDNYKELKKIAKG